jgi:hypothetical protein
MLTCLPLTHKLASESKPHAFRKLLWCLIRVIGVVSCAVGMVRSMQAPQGFGPALAFLGFFTALAAAYILRPDGRYGGL